MMLRPSFRLNRRAFLLGSGGSLISLPLLEGMFSSKSLAAGVTDPKRFVCMYIPNGTYIAPNNGANWFPAAAGRLSAAALPVTFEPFADSAPDFSIVKNINNRAHSKGVGGQHSKGISTFLTCSYAANNSATCSMQGDSFDQIVAQKSGLNDGRPLLMCGGAIGDQVADSTAFHYGEFLSYKGGKEAPPYKNPVSLYQDMFAALVASPNAGPGAAPAGLPRTLVANQSVLDNAVADIAALQAKLGAKDKQKLDDYLTSLRALEKQLSPAMSPPGAVGHGTAACGELAAPDDSLDSDDYYGNRLDYPQRFQAFNDMVVVAFKCDLVRSIAITFDTEAASRVFKNQIPMKLVYQGAQLNEERSHIGISHYGGDPAKPARCVTRDRFYLSYFFSLMDQLKSATDPSGTPLLDNTAILCGHGIVDGNHSGGKTGFPLVLGGGKNLGLNPGNSYTQGGDMSDLLFTLGSKLGLGLDKFQGSSKLLAL